MIAADALDVVGIHDLHVRERVMLGSDAVGGAGSFDRVDRGSHSGVVDGVDVQAEPRQMEAAHKLHDHWAVKLQLAGAGGVLSWVIAVCLDEGGERGRGTELGCVGAE